MDAVAILVVVDAVTILVVVDWSTGGSSSPSATGRSRGNRGRGSCGGACKRRRNRSRSPRRSGGRRTTRRSLYRSGRCEARGCPPPIRSCCCWGWWWSLIFAAAITTTTFDIATTFAATTFAIPATITLAKGRPPDQSLLFPTLFGVVSRCRCTSTGTAGNHRTIPVLLLGRLVWFLLFFRGGLERGRLALQRRRRRHGASSEWADQRGLLPVGLRTRGALFVGPGLRSPLLKGTRLYRRAAVELPSRTSLFYPGSSSLSTTTTGS